MMMIGVLGRVDIKRHLRQSQRVPSSSSLPAFYALRHPSFPHIARIRFSPAEDILTLHIPDQSYELRLERIPGRFGRRRSGRCRWRRRGGDLFRQSVMHQHLKLVQVVTPALRWERTPAQQLATRSGKQRADEVKRG